MVPASPSGPGRPATRMSFGQFVTDGPGDPPTQVGGYVVAALAGDEPAQLGLEAVAVSARRTVNQVLGDDLPLLVGQLTVEVVVDLVNCFAAVQTDPSTCRAGARGQTVFHGKLPQPLLKQLSSAMQAAHHRSDGDVEDIGDLLVGEALHVGQEHGHPE